MLTCHCDCPDDENSFSNGSIQPIHALSVVIVFTKKHCHLLRPRPGFQRFDFFAEVADNHLLQIMATAVQQAAPVRGVEGYKVLGHLAHGDGPLTKYSIPTSSIHIHILSSVIGQTILYLSLNTISGSCSHWQHKLCFS